MRTSRTTLLLTMALAGGMTVSRAVRPAMGDEAPAQGIRQTDTVVKPAWVIVRSRKQMPVAIRQKRSLPTESISLPALNVAPLIHEDSLREGMAKSGTRIGLVRTLPAVTGISKGRTAAWDAQPDGSQLWTFGISVPEARGIRVHIQNIQLPKGAALAVWETGDASNTVGTYELSWFQGRDHFWTETVFASDITLACHVPDGSDHRSVVFDVTEVIHIYKDITRPDVGKEGACHLDVTCSPAWEDEARAVAGLGIIQWGAYRFCTGCLLNDMDDLSYIDYFMTANHCVTDQFEANDLEFYWFFQTATCSGIPPSLASVPRSGGGADWLAGQNFYGNDFTFLKLRQPSPPNTAYAGWSTATPLFTEELTGIHHPDGSYKRISTGIRTGDEPGYWHVRWILGVTEPGSSGSPLFNDAQRFIGQLYGGYSSCQFPSGEDYYGRFDESFPHISQWLDAPSENWFVLAVTSGVPLLAGESWGGTGFTAVPGDYDGDSADDLALYQEAAGLWFVKDAAPGGATNLWAESWGGPGFSPVSGDYDGDGTNDLALYQEATGLWYVKKAAPGGAIILWVEQWGATGFTPVPGDYNNDGKDDLALYQEATGRWYVKRAAPNGAIILWAEQWGGPGFTPVPGDYGGSSRSDLAVYQSATGSWFIKQAAPDGTIILWAEQWGGPGFTPVSGDYGGAGQSDLAVYQDATGAWFIKDATPKGAIMVWALMWGATGDTPVPGDYDGDGVHDLAVYRTP